MTKEMAIKGLKENLCSLCAYGSQNMDSCDIRGCDNRDYIETLEQQPIEDCVSRQAVKEGMIKYGFRAPDMTVTEFIEDKLSSVSPKIPFCEDCVSRKAVLDCLTATGLKKFDFILDAREKVNNLPPVTPTRNVGEWIDGGRIDKGTFKRYKCSNCQDNVYEKEYLIKYHKYCLHCGAEMKGAEHGSN